MKSYISITEKNSIIVRRTKTMLKILSLALIYLNIKPSPTRVKTLTVLFTFLALECSNFLYSTVVEEYFIGAFTFVPNRAKSKSVTSMILILMQIEHASHSFGVRNRKQKNR